MPERVVDLAEAVEVDKKDSEHALLLRGASDGQIESFEEVGPVRQSGQLVVEGLAVDSLDLCLDALRHANKQRYEHREEDDEKPLEHRAHPKLQ